MRHDVVRRFEAYADRMEGVQDILSKLGEQKKAGSPKPEFSTNVKARVVDVRIPGAASQSATIRDSIAKIPGAQVRRDFIYVRAAGAPGAAEPVTTRSRGLDMLPLDESAIYPDQEALLRIDPEGRSRGVTGTGQRVVVAVVDSGIMVDHPDFKGHLWTKRVDGHDVHGARCMEGELDYDLTDQDGHGTMLAGSILATANFVGGLELMAVKFFDVVIQPSAANAARAIRFAVENGADIINLSFDLGIGSLELEEAVVSACAAGALVVMAAGNTGSNNDEYPLVPARYAASCPETSIVVMATDRYDERVVISNFGDKTVDLAAPGVGIASTRSSPGGGASRWYGRYTGTSAAAAQVSGAAALLKSKGRGRTASELKRRLMGTVDRLPRLRCVSGGRLNLGRALI
jgi:subtilisin family serine protease